MKTRQELQQTLGLTDLPKEYLKAYINAVKLETESLIQKQGPPRRRRKAKAAGSSARKIKFGNVLSIDSYGQKREKNISDAAESTKNGSIKSALFIEKYISSLLIYINPSEWKNYPDMPCSTKISLLKTLKDEKLDFNTFATDLYKIYNDFLKYKSSILGYKSGWLFKKMQSKKVKTENFLGEIIWRDIGLKVDVTHSLKMYLLKIVQAERMASVIIQKNWRRKKVQLDRAKTQLRVYDMVLCKCVPLLAKLVDDQVKAVPCDLIVLGSYTITATEDNDSDEEDLYS